MNSPENWKDFHSRSARSTARLVRQWQEAASSGDEGKTWEALAELTHYLRTVDEYADENY